MFDNPLTSHALLSLNSLYCMHSENFHLLLFFRLNKKARSYPCTDSLPCPPSWCLPNRCCAGGVTPSPGKTLPHNKRPWSQWGKDSRQAVLINDSCFMWRDVKATCCCCRNIFIREKIRSETRRRSVWQASQLRSLEPSHRTLHLSPLPGWLTGWSWSLHIALKLEYQQDETVMI